MRIKRHVLNKIRKYHGYTPRITEYNGKIYVSDPIERDNYKEFENETDLAKYYMERDKNERKNKQLKYKW